MRQREIKAIIKTHPEISSMSFNCRKFPRWLDVSPEKTSTCESVYVDGKTIFFHLQRR